MKRGRKKHQFTAKELKYWTSLDWSWCDAAVARRTKRRIYDIRRARAILGIPIGKRGKKTGDACRKAIQKAVIPKKAFKTATDTELSKRYNVCRERVRQLRKIAGLPSSKLLPHNTIREAAMRVTNWNRPNQEIANEIGSAIGYVTDLRRTLGKQRAPTPTRKCKYNWASVDWSLPLRKIAEQLGASEGVVCGQKVRLRKKGILPPSGYNWSKP